MSKIRMVMVSYQKAHILYLHAGTQLTLCKESCNIVDRISDRCQSQFTAIKGNILGALLDYVYNFSCSSPESYLTPSLPPDTEQCLHADDICEFISCAFACITYVCIMHVRFIFNMHVLLCTCS